MHKRMTKIVIIVLGIFELLSAYAIYVEAVFTFSHTKMSYWPITMAGNNLRASVNIEFYLIVFLTHSILYIPLITRYLEKKAKGKECARAWAISLKILQYSAIMMGFMALAMFIIYYLQHYV